MKRVEKFFFRLFFLFLAFGTIIAIASPAKRRFVEPLDLLNDGEVAPPDSLGSDTSLNLRYPIPPTTDQISGDKNPIYLKTPSNLKKEVVYDAESNTYLIYEKIGDRRVGKPKSLTPEEYLKYDMNSSVNNYWKDRVISEEAAGSDRIIPQIYIRNKIFETIFGSNVVDIRPTGFAELKFGLRTNKNNDNTKPERARKQVNFDFDMNIQANVLAKIGDKIELNFKYNTQATFDFDNKLKLRYEGKEDEIIKLIEAGNVSLPLNSQLIQGSQSLFGIKTQLKFGRTTVTGIFSQQESEVKNITVQGGAQQNKFKLTALDYEENKHFFIGHYFRDNYEKGLTDLPVVSSNVNITKIEVWVTNVGPPIDQNRNIISFQDLGEGLDNNLNNPNRVKVNPADNDKGYPDNNANDLYARLLQNAAQLRDINTVTQYLQSAGYTPGSDFEKLEGARKLEPNEYTINSKLGFISLNYVSLKSDQVLAVAFQYQVIGDENKVYQVGEFSDQGINTPDALVVKLLKPVNTNTRYKLWDLMMKNVYKIDATRINKQGFIMNILYQGGAENIPTGYFRDDIPGIQSVPLINLFGLDNLNQQLVPVPGGDGIFDFVDNASSNGGTIESSNGRIYFTKLEPFGSYLSKLFEEKGDAGAGRRYAFDSLYTTTKSRAEQFPDKNKFFLEGYYKSQGGSEIELNAFNVPQGSVKVTAGGRTLVENVDYVVEYTSGRVRIINEGILNSGTPINISLESKSLFNLQKKRMMGLRFDHEISKDFYFGGTLLNLHERPLTQKVNYGDDPISNTIWGVDLHYQTKSRWLTKMIDKLPLISTSKESVISVDAEFAHFIPGYAKVIGQTGTSYVDDFDGTKSTIDLRNPYDWYLASTPQGQSDLFPEATDPNSGWRFRYNVALINWYYIDPLFYASGSRPGGVPSDDQMKSQYYQKSYSEQDLFPSKTSQYQNSVRLQPFEVSYYPDERGPYNYDTETITNEDKLEDPESRWGGIMRPITTTDFESANVEYVEFWLLDPFLKSEDYPNNEDNGGSLYIDLGTVSEDVLRSGRKAFENGLPTGPDDTETLVDKTTWGIVPRIQAIDDNFSTVPGAREYQDVGYNGLGGDAEREFLQPDFLSKIQSKLLPEVYDRRYDDPSSDKFKYFKNASYDNNAEYNIVRNRYKKYNNPSGNTPENSTEIYSRRPNTEDINGDNTLSEFENYFQYKIDLRPDKLQVEGDNFITDIRDDFDESKATYGTRWIQFRIPIDKFERIVGNIEDFKSIRYMRMFMKGFKRPVHLRFATLDLVRNNWRRYNQSLLAPGEYIPDDNPRTTFEIGAVNFEENNDRSPVNYVLPPGVKREEILGAANVYAQNEQSLVLKVGELGDGDSRAAFKTTRFDFRQYGHLKMYIHAENSEDAKETERGTLNAFVRIGSDFTQNYYEYEIPLTFTTKGDNLDTEVWPAGNIMDIDLKQLVNFKVERNEFIFKGNSRIQKNIPYKISVPETDGHVVTILGNPSISDVAAVMIGVRNPKTGTSTILPVDDGRNVSAEIWVNELRVTDFNKNGGWAATARLSADLADLGRVVVSGKHSTAGFGSLEQRLGETSREATTQFDVSTDMELGKFTPEDWGIRVPMHFDYSESHIKPEYNPLDPDIKLKDQLSRMDSEAQRNDLEKRVIDYTQRKSINFVNVRKDRVGTKKKKDGKPRKPQLYDIENLSATYAYSETYHRNIDIQYELERRFNGGLSYNFTTSPKPIRPFRKIKIFSKSKHLTFIRDFNFFLIPKSLTFNTQMNRMYQVSQYRAKSEGDVIIKPTSLWDWNWSRNYGFRWDLSKSLAIDYNSTAQAYIHEPTGQIVNGGTNVQVNADMYEIPNKWKLTGDIWNQIFDLGDLRNFNQRVNVSYKLPFNKFYILDWINGSAIYSANYTFIVPSINLAYVPKDANGDPIQNPAATDFLGNNIENSNTKQINGTFDLTKLYNKVPYFKKINSNTSRGLRTSRRPGNVKSVSAIRMNTTDKVGMAADSTKKKVNYFKIVGDQTLKLMMSIKRMKFTFNEGNGMFLPAYIPRSSYLGYNYSYNSPGWGFIFGDERNVFDEAVDKDWLSHSDKVNSAFSKKFNQRYQFEVTIEPVKNLKIDLKADRSFSQNSSQYFRYSDVDNRINVFSPTMSGSFSTSFGIWNTAFVMPNKDNISATFENFKDYRSDVARLLADEDSRVDLNNPNHWIPYDTLSDGSFSNYYPVGYGPTSRQVIQHSFLTAYQGLKPGQTNTKMFPDFPIPNWRLRYTGLTDIPFLKEYFKTITLSHAYQSAYAISSFRTNVNFLENKQEYYPNTFNFIGRYEVDQIVISEKFAPLGGLEFTLQNDLTFRFAYNKTRDLALSFVNNQLTEVLGREYVFSAGYRIQGFSLSFLSASSKGSGKSTKPSDINIRGDVKIRDDKTTIRWIDRVVNQVTAGKKIITYSFTADYNISDKINLALYYDRQVNNPVVSSQISTSQTDFGFKLRFNLAQ
ncbi:MAG: cell surface protein SprA [Bacteroidales bacterium]